MGLSAARQSDDLWFKRDKFLKFGSGKLLDTRRKMGRSQERHLRKSKASPRLMHLLHLELEIILAHYMLFASVWLYRKIGCKVRSEFLRITLLVLSSRASFRAASH